MKNLVRLPGAVVTAMVLCLALSSTVVFSSAGSAPAVAGTTITVNSTSDAAANDGLCTLREAITSANVNADSGAASGECAAGTGDDTITFSVTGTINLTGALPDINSNLTIGGPGSSQLTVRRDTGGDYRIFTVSNVTAAISGLTVTNGRTPDGTPANFGSNGGDGGGIANFGTLTLTDVTVTANATGVGGAGNNGGGDGGGGGGVFNQGTLTMTSCVISGNTTGRGGDCPNFAGRGGDGGGVLSMFNTADLNDVSITNNTAGDSGTGNGGFGGMGGGLMVRGVSSMTLTNSTVSDNKSGNSSGGTNGFGGGAMVNGTLFVSGSTFSANTTGGPGGGLMNQGSGTLKMFNSTVSGNLAGGGVFDDSSTTLWLTNCTVANNAEYGVQSFSGHALVRNTIIAGNGSGPDVLGVYNSQGHNIVGNGDGGMGFNAAGDQVGSTAAPINARLGPLASNGGPTLTHALLAGSPAIEAGDNSLPVDVNNNTLTTDQRGTGFARFADSADADTTQTVDIGAFEANPAVEDISDKQMFENSTLSFNFNVGDAALGLTSVTAASSIAALVPNDAAHISVTGTGSQRTINITPSADAIGTATITVTATAANGRTASDIFRLSVIENSTTISAVSGSGTYAGTATLTATLTAGGNGLSGKSVAFTLKGNSVGSATTNASGVATLTGVSLSGINAGTYVNVVGAAFVGDASFKGSSGVGSLTVSKASQTITFNALSDKTYGDADFNVSATASSGLTVSFGAMGSCTVSDSTVHLTGAGGCRITATQFGDFNYDGAVGVAHDFNIARASTSVAVSSSANPSAVGQGVTFTATVTSPAGFVPGGIFGVVNFFDGGVAIPNCASLLNSGQAACTTSALTPGSHTITAEYGTISLSFTDSTGTLQGGQTVGSIFEFSQSAYEVAEGASLTVTVKRSGDTSQAVSVGYATDDGSTPSVVVPCSSVTGLALDRCDFTKALGTLNFAAGETQQTFLVLGGDDSYTEGPESARLRLSNPSAGAALGALAEAAFTIDDDSPESSGNPSDDDEKFVAQHYRDFLNRDPDAPGLGFWKGQLASCGSDAQCREVKRINVSAAFFLSIEFQQTGYFVYKTYKVAYGDATSPGVAGSVPVIRLNEFVPDTQRIGQGVVVGQGNWQRQLDANQVAFMLEFVQRQRFTAAFPTSMTAEQFVDKVARNAGATLTQSEHDNFVAYLNFGPADPSRRAEVFRGVMDAGQVHAAEFNRAFVLMEYYGYLRRNPDDAPEPTLNFAGWKFWLDKLNSFGGNYIQAEMVKAFISSDEYRHRFGR
jgi:CSLREA domain-containing protein